MSDTALLRLNLNEVLEEGQLQYIEYGGEDTTVTDAKLRLHLITWIQGRYHESLKRLPDTHSLLLTGVLVDGLMPEIKEGRRGFLRKGKDRQKFLGSVKEKFRRALEQLNDEIYATSMELLEESVG